MMVSDRWILPQKGARSVLFLEICPELSAPSTWLVRSWVCVVPQGYELNFSSTKSGFYLSILD